MKIESSATLKDLRTLESDILAAARQALGQAAALAAAHARATTAFKDRRADLRNSVVRGAKGPWAQFVSVGGKKAPHALWIEGGSHAHEIVPRRRKFLRFVHHGKIRFARRVFHPGTKATRFVQSARDAGETAIVRFVTIGLNSAIQK